MSDAAVFILRFSVFVLLHSLLAVPDIKSRFAGHSAHLRRFYRLYYNLFSLGLFGWVMAAYRNSSVLFVAPGVWSLVLYAVQLILVVVLAGCVRQTGAADFIGLAAASPNGTRSSRLVTDGWYRVVRHPLYLFSILFLFSNPVITVRWFLLSMVSTAYFIAGAVLEERRLLREFGSEYREYQRTVPFLLPRVARGRVSG